MTNNTKQLAQLKAAIEALEAQRSTLGDAVVDISLKGLQQQIIALEIPKNVVSKFLGERRHATILFSDLSGYTAMNEQIDPEKVQELMSQIKLEATKIVEYHEGTVNQFIGDEIIALFGIPYAHEDDPVRAVKSALEIHTLVNRMSLAVETQIGRPLNMHSGINTGLIVISVQDERDGKFNLTGDTVNTGARLVAQAQADEIILSPQTQALIAPYFRTKSLGPVSMKGKAEPITPYLILGKTTIQTRLEAAEKRGFTPYIGRKKELANLHACFLSTIRGQGQLVTIRGAAGLGKSRLLYEFQHQLNSNNITVLQANCRAYGVSTPYLPFLDILRAELELSEEDSPEQLHSKTVDHLKKIDPALNKYIPVFLHLLSIPSEQYPLPAGVSGEQLKLMIQEGLIVVNTLKAKQQPLILILEDWHCADEGSETVLRRYLEVMANLPLMIILVYRPEYTPKWKSPSFNHHIELDAISEHLVESMIKAKFKVADLPEQLPAQIFKRTGGNPFFIEELCDLLHQKKTILIESGKLNCTQTIEKYGFPQTVESVILARLDQLDPYLIEVLRLASVIGREFKHRILGQIITQKEELPASLQHLELRNFINQIEHLTELTYQFNHVITQEVTYRTLLIRQRNVLHQLVGESIEVLYQERLEEHFEALAYHYSNSKQQAKAIEYLVKAGEKAGKQYANTEALTYFDQALVLAEKNDDYDGILIRRGKVLLNIFQGTKAAKDFFILLNNCKKAGDRKGVLEAALGLALAYYIIALDKPDYASKSLKLYEEAYSLAKELNDQESMIRALIPTMWFTDFWPNYLEQAVANIEQAWTISQDYGDQELIFECLIARANKDLISIKQVEELLRQLESDNDLPRLKEAYFRLLWRHLFAGNYTRCIECCEASIKLSVKLGAPPVIYSTIKALALSKLGRYEEAWESIQQEFGGEAYLFGSALKKFAEGIYLSDQMAYEQAAAVFGKVVEQAEQMGRSWLKLWAQAELSRALLHIKRPNKVSMSWSNQNLANTPTALLAEKPVLLGEIALRKGNFVEALTFARNSCSVAEKHGWRPAHVIALELQLRILLKLDRAGDVISIADEGILMAEQMNYSSLELLMQISKAKALTMKGNTDMAMKQYQASATIIHELADNMGNAHLKQSFLSNRCILPVLELTQHNLKKIINKN